MDNGQQSILNSEPVMANGRELHPFQGELAFCNDCGKQYRQMDGERGAYGSGNGDPKEVLQRLSE